MKAQAHRALRTQDEPHASKLHYTLHMTLCTLVVSLCRLAEHTPYMYITMSVFAAMLSVVLVRLRQHIGSTADMASCRDYIITTIYLMFSLHHLSTLIGTHMSNPTHAYTRTQHTAVHFALSFFALTEAEFCRRSLAHCGDPGTLSSRILVVLRRAVDKNFPVARFPTAYWYRPPVHLTGEPPFSDDEEARGIPFRAFGLLFLSQWVFHGVNGCLNYALRSWVNPNPNLPGVVCSRSDTSRAVKSCYKFVSSCGLSTHLFDEGVWYVFLVEWYVFSRVVAHTNFVGVWAVVGGAAWVRRWLWEERGCETWVRGEKGGMEW